jgi:hypothetical protein
VSRRSPCHQQRNGDHLGRRGPGTNLSGALTVGFNGVAAVITTDKATEIITHVAVGATTGSVTVTTGGGTATGPKKFKET